MSEQEQENGEEQVGEETEADGQQGWDETNDEPAQGEQAQDTV